MRIVSKLQSAGRAVLAVALLLALLAACAKPVPPPELNPAGPLTTRVGTIIGFTVSNIDGVPKWSVNDVEGGTPSVGTIIVGEYQAPTRVPTDPTVTVSASDPNNPGRSASAAITITAPGTFYVLESDAIHVYNDMDVADGDIAPDRTFTLDGLAGTEFYDMALAPELDTAFISAHIGSPNIFRVSDISSASGTLPSYTSFAFPASMSTSGLAYDAERDILYAATNFAVLAYDDASSAPDGQEPTRVLEGPSLEPIFLDVDSRLRVDAANDRLFVVNYEGAVAVYDAASTVTGEKLPDRLIEVDEPPGFIWGAAYDASRDELYLSDQASEGPIFVIADASVADGPVTPARVIVGPATQLVGASQINYDVANDRLVVVDADGNSVKVFDNASTLDGDVAPTRVIGGTLLPLNYSYGGYLDPTQ